MKNINADYDVKKFIPVVEALRRADGKMCPLRDPILLRQTLCDGNVVRGKIEAEDLVTDSGKDHRVHSRAAAEVQQFLVFGFEVLLGNLYNAPVRIPGTRLFACDDIKVDL